MTGNAVYDALGSITIGCLLGCTAVFLIQQNRSLLLGEMPVHLYITQALDAVLTIYMTSFLQYLI